METGDRLEFNIIVIHINDVVLVGISPKGTAPPPFPHSILNILRPSNFFFSPTHIHQCLHSHNFFSAYKERKYFFEKKDDFFWKNFSFFLTVNKIILTLLKNLIFLENCNNLRLLTFHLVCMMKKCYFYSFKISVLSLNKHYKNENR